MESDRQRVKEAGCNGYIPKPIDVDELPGQIAGFIAGGSN
jgi:CheY-like chemotaxis protein